MKLIAIVLLMILCGMLYADHPPIMHDDGSFEAGLDTSTTGAGCITNMDVSTGAVYAASDFVFMDEDGSHSIKAWMQAINWKINSLCIVAGTAFLTSTFLLFWRKRP